MVQRVCILGATGSIGTSTLDVIARHPEQFSVFALTAHGRIDELAALCRQHRPQYAVTTQAADATKLQHLLADLPITVLYGPSALAEVAASSEVNIVMAAIVGAAGLDPTLAAVRAGKRVLLANKEALVMAGALFMAEVQRAGTVLLPIDSEHNAVFQCLPSAFAANASGVIAGVRRIVLTASGGPFRNSSLLDMEHVTPEQACAHPNWSMGKKISVDSASMMNKGLEVIEAHWLFGLAAERIEIVIHPQSIIHSFVDYEDGSMLAQLGNPDMRTPIAQALAWPQRIASGVAPLDLLTVGHLEFSAPDLTRFPCLGLAYQALRLGGTAPAILNAANEVAVMAFLAGQLRFTRIAAVIGETLERLPAQVCHSLEDIQAADHQARRIAEHLLAGQA